MLKKKFPILEFDNKSEALINPDILKGKYPILPERMIICFFKEVIDSLINDETIEYLYSIVGENEIKIYKFKDYDCAIVHGALGAPACAGYLEEFIALGTKKVMFCGGAGVLRKDITVGKLIVINSAVRDEGFSYHYLKPSREVEASEEMVKKITEFLDKERIDYIVGKTWTTDAFYRETKNKIALRKKEGCLIVEMEQAAMLAVSKYRNVEYGAIIYGGDDVSGEYWDNRSWRDRSDIRKALCDICLKILIEE